MDKQRLLQLLNKHEDGTISESESIELEEWYNSIDLKSPPIQLHEIGKLKKEMLYQFHDQFAKTSLPLPVFPVNWRLLRAAAVISGLLICMIAYYLSVNNSKLVTASKNGEISYNSGDIPPGSSRAILILGNGSQIDLHQSKPGILTQQGGVQIIKKADGTLGYHYSGNGKIETTFNTIRTPRGGEYKLTLPDGSQVWLNASSAIKYPTVFDGKERRVEISGEAYFEVEKNPAMPFIVSVNGKQDVRVLGTHFNINAYEEEGPEKVTLLEGSVKVSDKNYAVILHPGQQSSLTEIGFKIEEADIDQVTAWKSGFFEFSNSSLESIMRGISRWYDVDVVYESRPKDLSIFGGRINKHLPLSKALEMLEPYGIQAKINGKEILITEKSIEK
ncbi:MAG: FecR domain-containing protein [Chitinophagaceae bacterium]|nr:FecR domain-containing protein [Chitinophagaceae bacterium]